MTDESSSTLIQRVGESWGSAFRDMVLIVSSILIAFSLEAWWDSRSTLHAERAALSAVRDPDTDARSAVRLGGAKWQVRDQVTAMILACFLAVVAWRIIRGAGDELMDRAPSQRVLEQIEQAVGQTGGVRSFHAFRARKLGGMGEMDIHVQVDPELTVARGHDIATEVGQRVEECCPNVINVVVHVEPVE